jgi:hypothetical protein
MFVQSPHHDASYYDATQALLLTTTAGAGISAVVRDTLCTHMVCFQKDSSTTETVKSDFTGMQMDCGRPGMWTCGGSRT